MSITLITGVPGAGKTYLAVLMLVDMFFDFDKESGLYQKKEQFKDTTIITNIDNLSLDAEHLDNILKDCKTNFDGFFTKEFQEKVSKKHKRILYVIDEAQRFIGPYFRNQPVIFYFDYHRHLGHDLWLITQDRYKISKQISCLAEFEYRAVKRSLSLFGELKYNILSSGEIVDRKVVKPKKEIYNLYRSMVATESTKIKSRHTKYLVFMFIALLISGYLLKSRFKTRREETRKLSKQVNQSSETKPNRGASSISKSEIFPDESKTTWMQVSSVRIGKDIAAIFDPVTNQLMPKTMYPYKYKAAARTVWVAFPEHITQQLLTARREAARAAASSSAAEPDLYNPHTGFFGQGEDQGSPEAVN